jgi:hypothetical protein
LDNFRGVRSPAKLVEIPLRPHGSSANDDGRAIYFDVDTLSRLSTPSRLNDVCINDCASLLQRLFNGPHSKSCAVISTHALTDHRAASDDNRVWRVTKVSGFWTRTKWIIPIHRPIVPEHWVLCVVDIVAQHIDFFDSLAEVHNWLPDVKVCFYGVCILPNSCITTGRNVSCVEAGKNCGSQWSSG